METTNDIEPTSTSRLFDSNNLDNQEVASNSQPVTPHCETNPEGGGGEEEQKQQLAHGTLIDSNQGDTSKNTKHKEEEEHEEACSSPDFDLDDSDDDSDQDEFGDDIYTHEPDKKEPPLLVRKMSSVNSAGKLTSSASRLMKELSDILRSKLVQEGTFKVDVPEENIYSWFIDVKIPEGNSLHEDFKKINKEPIMKFNLVFEDDFPFSPPFARIVEPKVSCKYIVSGGAICLELLTKGVSKDHKMLIYIYISIINSIESSLTSITNQKNYNVMIMSQGWSCVYSIESVIVQIIALLDTGKARLAAECSRSYGVSNYSLKDARMGFRVVESWDKHGRWFTPPKSEG